MATPWAPQAAHVAAQFGIPKGIFLALVHQESGFNPNAVSPAGARGLTQLMPATARSLGVNMADPHAQLVGGAKYLRAQFDRFGSWKLALAAYNAGPGNVTDGAWQRIPETQNYVKTILGSVGKYGGVQPQAPAPPAAGPTAPQIPAPVLRGSAGLNVNAFAGDELGHLGDPGFALNNLASGSYDMPLSAKLTAIAAPKTTGPAVAASPVGKSIVLHTGLYSVIPAKYATRAGIRVAAGLRQQVEQIVNQFGVKVNSGYRTQQHNAAVGGAENSDHLRGIAVDFVGTQQQMQQLYRWAQGRFPYIEPWSQAGGNHVHISFLR